VNRFSVVFAVIFSAVCVAQVPQIKSGSTVYIEPMDGYETYLTAAIVKKHVPLVVVTEKDKAEYIVRTTITHRDPTEPEVVINTTTNVNSSGFPTSGFPKAGNGQGHTDASISIIDADTSRVVFAYSAAKGANHQMQSTAEACAKHLKEFIEKSEKATK
jgi:hypothetical protein